LFFCASALQAAIILAQSVEVRQGLVRMVCPRRVTMGNCGRNSHEN
jgi:hypothetical protein